MTAARARSDVRLRVFAAHAQPPATVTIGGERSAGAELGMVKDVAVLPELLVVLERGGPHLKVFDHSGRLRQTLGRSGSGPGEFRAPFAVTYDSVKRQLYVVDPANSRVTEYAVADTLRLTRTLATDVVSLVDVCVLRGRLFGLSRSGPQMLRELDIDIDSDRLTARRSLGARRTSHPLATHSILQGYIGDGGLLCDSATGTIFVASRLLGEVHVLSVETGAQQTVPIRDFRPIKLEAGPGNRLNLSFPESGAYEALEGLLPVDDGVAVVVGRREKGEELAAFATVNVSRSGAQGSRHTRRWQPVGAAGPMAICLQYDPYPTIAYFRAASCP